MIEFDHECTVAGTTYPVNSQVEEATLPADWVTGALAANFVHRVATSMSTPDAGEIDPTKTMLPPSRGKVPPDVQAKLDAALGK